MLNRRTDDKIRALILAILLIVSVFGLTVSFTGQTAAAGNTITVDDSGGADEKTIQAAIDNASSGDTIVVRNGTYAGGNVTKSLTITSETGNHETAEAVITGNGSQFTITDGVENVTITGFDFHEIRGSGGSSIPVLFLGNSTNATIQSNEFSDIVSPAVFTYGDSSHSDLVVRDNLIDGVGGTDTSGMLLSGSTSKLSIANNVVNNTTYAGAIIENIDGGTIEDNVVSHTPQKGIQLNDSSNVTVARNAISDTSSDAKFFEGAITLIDVSNVTVSNNSLRDNQQGLTTLNATGSDDAGAISGIDVRENDFTTNGVQINDSARVVDISAALRNNQFDRAVVVNNPSTGFLPTIWSHVYDGIDNASSGDTVRLEPGRYVDDGTIRVAKDIDLVGSGQMSTTVYANSSTVTSNERPTIQIAADATIKNLTIIREITLVGNDKHTKALGITRGDNGEPTDAVVQDTTVRMVDSNGSDEFGNAVWVSNFNAISGVRYDVNATLDNITAENIGVGPDTNNFGGSAVGVYAVDKNISIYVKDSDLDNSARGIYTLEDNATVSAQVTGSEFKNNTVQIVDNAESLELSKIIQNNQFDRAVVVDNTSTGLLPTVWSQIQDGVDAAGPGDTVKIQNGRYNESVTADVSATISGTGPASVIVDPGTSGSALTVSASGVRIDNLTLTSDGRTVNAQTFGLTLVDATVTSDGGDGIYSNAPVTIANTTIRQSGGDSGLTAYGIRLDPDADGSYIERSRFEGFMHGVLVVDASDVSVTDTTFAENFQLFDFDGDGTADDEFGTGVKVVSRDENVANVTVTGSTFTNNARGVTVLERHYDVNGGSDLPDTTATDIELYDNSFAKSTYFGVVGHRETNGSTRDFSIGGIWDLGVLSSPVNATHNYWDAPTGPGGNVTSPHAIPANGNGDNISANVTFTPIYVGAPQSTLSIAVGSSSVDGNGTAVVDLKNGTVNRTTVSLPSGSNASWVTVVEAPQPTAGAPTLGRSVATYLEVAGDEPVSGSVDVSVTLPENALDGIAPEDAVLIHFVNGTWTDIDTTATVAGNVVTLDATADSLSTFAVAEVETASTPTKTDDSGGSGGTSPETSTAAELVGGTVVFTQQLQDDAPDESGTTIHFEAGEVDGEIYEPPIVEIAFEDDISDTQPIEVSIVEEQPSREEVGEDVDRIMRTFRIDAPLHAEDRPATIRFAVSQARLGDRSPGAVMLARQLDDGSWQLYNGTPVDPNADPILYEGDIEGFSKWSVVIRPMTTPTATSTSTPSLTETATSTEAPKSTFTTTRETAVTQTKSSPPPAEEPFPQVPGFGFSIAIVALIATAALALRRVI